MLPLHHGPGACLGALTHCTRPGKHSPQRGRDLPANSAHPCKPSLTQTRAVERCIAPGNSALPKNILLTSLCAAQSQLLCTSIHSRTGRSLFLPLFSRAHIAVTTDSPSTEREQLEISQKSKLAFRPKGPIPKYICMYVCAYMYLRGREK